METLYVLRNSKRFNKCDGRAWVRVNSSPLQWSIQQKCVVFFSVKCSKLEYNSLAWSPTKNWNILGVGGSLTCFDMFVQCMQLFCFFCFFVFHIVKIIKRMLVKKKRKKKWKREINVRILDLTMLCVYVDV